MKRIENRVLLSMIILVGTLLQTCSPKDTAIKAGLLTKTRLDINFAGVRFTVDKGVVTLSGECATEKSKSRVTDQQLKQEVDSPLRDYPVLKQLQKIASFI